MSKILFVLAGFVGLLGSVACGQVAQLPLPNRAQITAEHVALGKMLYWDTRLSANGTVACATCHHPAAGYSDNRQGAVGIFQQVGRVNSPTTLNAAYGTTSLNQFGQLLLNEPRAFVDGRTRGLPTQSLQPLVNPIEMGNASENQVLNRLRNIQGYQVAFARAFGSPGIDRQRFGHAMAAYQSTLVTNDDTPLHRRWAGERGALTDQQEHGLQLMVKAQCFACHVPPVFTDKLFHNNGMAWASLDNSRGRAAIVGGTQNIRAFKTASLNEAARTAPYGFNGRFPDLTTVVRHYNVAGMRSNGQRDPLLDPRIQPQGWSAEDEAAVVSVLRYATASPSYPLEEMPDLPR